MSKTLSLTQRLEIQAAAKALRWAEVRMKVAQGQTEEQKLVQTGMKKEYYES